MSEETMLSVRIQHQLGALLLDVDFRLTAPWTLIFGASGSGKSTLLRCIAGFLRPDTGCVHSGQKKQVLLDTDRGIFVPPHHRPVRSASQAAKLFPSMRLADNVTYGVGSKLTQEETEAMTEVVLKLFHLHSKVDRWPRELSGGERQRASVARAVLAAVTCHGSDTVTLLLDEPFTGLDVALRDELAGELRSFLRHNGVPVLSVSHDIVEAFLLEAEVLRMDEGQIVAQGAAGSVLHAERVRMLTGLAK